MRIGSNRVQLFAQTPTQGTRWCYGNFSLGLLIDSYPRFLNVIVAFGFFELGLSVESIAEERI